MVKKAIIPTGRQMKSYACMRLLSRQGISTLLASECEYIPQFSSRYCDDNLTLSSPTDNLVSYKNELLDLAAREDIETIFPTREHDAYLLAKFREEFEQHTSIVVPSLDTLKKAHDRIRLAEEADKAGVPTPETRPLSDAEAWDTELIVKSRFNLLTGDYINSYPRGEVAEVKTVRHLRPDDRPDLDEIRAEMNHEPIAQEFVPQGEKYMFCALYDHGEALATYQHREVRGNSWVGGGGVYRESAYSQRLEEVAVDLLDHLEWHGLACLEYIKDANSDEWKVLELNPKLWQSLPATIRANADFPYYYWLQATNQPNEIDPTYDLGVGCHMLYGELSYLRSILHDESPLLERPSFSKTAWEIIKSCFTEPHFDHLHLDDPRPFLNGVRVLFSGATTDSKPDQQ